MIVKKATSLLAGIAGLGLLAGLALATPDEAIKARQAQMKAQNKAAGEMFAMLKGEKAYDAAAVKAHIDAINAGGEAAMKVNAWAAENATGTIETRAKPEIWSDPEGFKAAWTTFGKAMSDLATTTDEAGFKAAMPAVGAACAGCHEKFRAPKQE